jgi:hypothetical protein
MSGALRRQPSDPMEVARALELGFPPPADLDPTARRILQVAGEFIRGERVPTARDRRVARKILAHVRRVERRPQVDAGEVMTDPTTTTTIVAADARRAVAVERIKADAVESAHDFALRCVALKLLWLKYFIEEVMQP